MTSAMTVITLLLAFVILQCGGVTAARARLRNAEKLTERASSPTKSHRQLTERNVTKQGFIDPCSCDKPCLQGRCGTGIMGLILFDKPSCFPESALDIIDVDELFDFKPLQCPPATCIAADMLDGYASHELIFEKHVLAPVLCDSSSSCATKGHIVNYKGTGMMMGSYCDIVGCQEKIMPVNSPKYSRALKVQSKSPELHFTAFAARFETRGEEAILAAAVRVGL